MFDKRKDPAAEPTAPTPAATRETPTSTENFTSRSTAVIGQTIQIKGTITGNENLVIEGKVEGSINLSQNDLTVGQSGNVTADVTAKTVKIDGQVTGDISGEEKVIVSKSGKVKGNIVAPRVTLEDGAKFKGSIDMDPGEAKPVPKAATKPHDKAMDRPADGKAAG